MRERLRRIVSVLCILALALGCLAYGAAEQTQQYGIVTINWQDENDADGIRPASVTIGGAILTAENGWTGIVAVPLASTDVPSLGQFYYSDGTISVNGDITTVTYVHRVEKRTVTPQVLWLDENNAKGIRPSSLPIRVLQNGNPYTAELKVGASNGWGLELSLPENLYGRMESAAYAISAPDVAGYKKNRNGVEMVYTLQTGKLSLNASVSGAPAGADLSGLRLRVDGPDPMMPAPLTYADIANGSVSFGDVLPGVYLVEDLNADTLVPGYRLNGSASRVADAVQVLADGSAELNFRFVYSQPDAVKPEDLPDPNTNLGALSFDILGPDPDQMPIRGLTYAQFTNGEYTLENLVPGTYVVVERNAETLVDLYTLRSDSTTGLILTVEGGKTVTARLYNHYAPAPTPEPDAVTVSVPVVKIWNDNNDADGNRPAQVTVRLYADGAETASAALNAANNWSYTFENLPRNNDAGEEIAYTIREDQVPQYRATIRGYNVVNDYEPETVSASVTKIWDDENNAAGMRPLSVAMSLSNGRETVAVAVLNESNGWSRTVNNLPALLDGQPAVYTWTEQQTLGYTLTDLQENGNNAVFTNTAYVRPAVEAARMPRSAPGNAFYIFEDYETPLGVEIMINHVGDCFD